MIDPFLIQSPTLTPSLKSTYNIFHITQETVTVISTEMVCDNWQSLGRKINTFKLKKKNKRMYICYKTECCAF